MEAEMEALLGSKESNDGTGDGMRDTRQPQDVEGGSARGGTGRDVGSIYTSPNKGISSEGVLSQQRKHSRDYDFRV